MRRLIVCFTLVLASWGVAAEQAKHPKKIIKTAVAKPMSLKPKAKHAANHGIPKEGKPVPSKSTASHVDAKESNAAKKVKRTAALKRSSDGVAAEKANPEKTSQLLQSSPRPSQKSQHCSHLLRTSCLAQ